MRKKLWAMVYSDVVQADSYEREPELGRALQAAHELADPGRILFVGLEQHRPWWESKLSGLPDDAVAAQPFDRGSGTGILLGTLELYRRDPEARVLLFIDADFASPAIDLARDVVQRVDPEKRLYLFADPGQKQGAQKQGIRAGWAIPRLSQADSSYLRVQRMVSGAEGPRIGRAFGLSGTLYTTVGTLFGLFEREQPLLTRRMLRELQGAGAFQTHALDGLYPFLTSVSFVSDVLANATDLMWLVPTLKRRPAVEGVPKSADPRLHL